jgi:NADPH-dependent 2,4-dienoyl-CoA reductase/sulfur reductase-like enzyme
MNAQTSWSESRPKTAPSTALQSFVARISLSHRWRRVEAVVNLTGKGTDMPTLKTDSDILIAGAGPVGLALAAELKRRGAIR